MISVALAYYNGGKYIKEQLTSILMQLGAKDEVIVSVDSVSDGSMELLEQISSQDARVRIVPGPGKGVVKNFEYAIGQCSGDIIFLSDQDDLWKENKVKKVMKAFGEHEIDVVLHNAEIIDGEGRLQDVETMFEFRNSNSGILKNLIKNSYVGCCMAFRSKLKEIILPIPEEMYMHDYWIATAGEKMGGVGLLKECLIQYRRHEENVTDMSHGSLAFMVKKRISMVKCLAILDRRIRTYKKKESGEE